MFAAVTALTAAGLVTVPAPAQAACKYEFPGSFTLNQSNGFRVEISAITGQNASGKAVSFNNRQQVTDAGDVTGFVNGNDVTLTVGWNGGAVGRYNGTVRGNGTVAGQTQDLANPSSTASWESVTALTCAAEAPAPPAAKPAPENKPAPPADPAPAPTATVTSDVDLYDAPGGGGNVIGILRAGNKVEFAGCRADNWCEVKGGWVFGDFLQKP